MQRFTEPGGLVGERNLQRVEIVAAVFDHLGRAYGGRIEFTVKMAKQLAHLGDRRLRVCARNRERWFVVVSDRCAFAEELGLKADIEVLPFLFFRFSLNNRRRTSSTVPGTKVDRKTNICLLDLLRMARPRSLARFNIAVWSWLPFGADSVLTQMSDSSVSRLHHIGRC
jgi:hypothetical protein